MAQTCSLALKEWAVVCEALAAGAQQIIFRKGGIHEGPDGFVPEHPAFWLFPTGFHQSLDGLRPEFHELAKTWALAPPAGEVIALQHYCTVQSVRWVEREADLFEFRHQHVLTDELLHERFVYRRPGIFLMAVSTASLPAPVRIPSTSRYDGCKSWVQLEDMLCLPAA